jgi:hypothetical protein
MGTMHRPQGLKVRQQHAARGALPDHRNSRICVGSAGGDCRSGWRRTPAPSVTKRKFSSTTRLRAAPAFRRSSPLSGQALLRKRSRFWRSVTRNTIFPVIGACEATGTRSSTDCWIGNWANSFCVTRCSADIQITRAIGRKRCLICSIPIPGGTCPIGVAPVRTRGGARARKKSPFQLSPRDSGSAELWIDFEFAGSARSAVSAELRALGSGMPAQLLCIDDVPQSVITRSH